MTHEELMQAIQSAGRADMLRMIRNVLWQQLTANEVQDVLHVVFQKFVPMRETEQPMYIGHALALTGHDEQDALAIAWLAKNPTEVRLYIVANFLAGLWSTTRRKKPIGEREVEEVLRIRHHLIVETSMHVGVGLEAFYNTVRGNAMSAKSKKRIAEVLSDAQKKLCAPGEKDSFIQKLLDELGYSE